MLKENMGFSKSHAAFGEEQENERGSEGVCNINIEEKRK